MPATTTSSMAVMICGTCYSPYPCLNDAIVHSSLVQHVLEPLAAAAYTTDVYVCMSTSDPPLTSEVLHMLQPKGVHHFNVTSLVAQATLQKLRRLNGGPLLPIPGKIISEADWSRNDKAHGSLFLQYHRLAKCAAALASRPRRLDRSSSPSWVLRTRPDLVFINAPGPWPHPSEKASGMLVRLRSAHGFLDDLVDEHFSNPAFWQYNYMCGQPATHLQREASRVIDKFDSRIIQPCVTVDDMVFAVSYDLLNTIFDEALRNFSASSFYIRKRHLPECGCWDCAEGMLTAYLQLIRVPMRLLRLPATLAKKVAMPQAEVAKRTTREGKRRGVWSHSYNFTVVPSGISKRCVCCLNEPFKKCMNGTTLDASRSSCDVSESHDVAAAAREMVRSRRLVWNGLAFVRW
mmetsp:Transcript_29679/g.86779  ORF Transcript_29679/g.86779 Transcript_29679/m.86779 type:complete len:404 (-) Transcript_29679:117-1328(-)